MSQPQVVQAPQPQVKPTVTKIGGPKVDAPKVDAPAATAAPAVDFAAEQAKLKAATDELAKQGRRHALERQKLSEERRAHQKMVDEAKKWATERESFKLNPEPFLKAEIGDDYYDKLTNMRLSGGAPPAQVVAAEIKALNERWEKKLNDVLAERDTAAKTAQQGEAQKRYQATTQALKQEASDFVKANAKDYGVLLAVGDEAGLGAMLAQRIESEYNKSERRDPKTGELLFPGKVLSAKEAADLVEQEVLALVEKVTATEKWKSRGRPTSGTEAQQRRTLTNSVTGRTPGREPPVSDDERRERAIRAYNDRAARNASQ